MQQEKLMNERKAESPTVTLDRAVLQRILKIAIWSNTEGLGGALTRMMYMRDALGAAIEGDLSVLEDAEGLLKHGIGEADRDPWRNNPKARPMKHPGAP